LVNLQALLSRLSRIDAAAASSVSAPRLSCASAGDGSGSAQRGGGGAAPRRSAGPAQLCRVELELADLDLGDRHLVDGPSRWLPAAWTRLSGSFAFSVPNRAALPIIISVNPMMA
jgi:hypothetical protein